MNTHTQKSYLIASHANCLDGAVAAWIAYDAISNMCHLLKVNEVKIIYLNYDEESVNELKNHRQSRMYDCLFILDYSVSTDVLLDLEEAHPIGNIVLLDHHETAFLNLLGEGVHPNKRTIYRAASTVILDASKSGCLLTWDYFYGEGPVPRLVTYVNDHDLWKKRLPHTKEVAAYLKWTNQKYTVDAMYKMNNLFQEDKSFEALVREGASFLRFQNLLIEQLLLYVKYRDDAYRDITYGEITVDAAVNNDILKLVSEIGEAIYKTKPVVARVRCKLADGRYKVSLRSNRDDINCATLAKEHGGGGHKGAASYYEYVEGN